MPRLPPTEKLPLAVRKNVRDEWDNKKADLEKQLSDVLGTAWTIEVNPNAIYSYASEGYGKDSLGSCIYNYFSSAVDRLKEFENTHGDEGKAEINNIAYAHVMTLDLDELPKFSYCGVIIQDGKFAIVFKEGNLGTNSSYALDRDVLAKALNDAPAAAPDATAPPMSYKARVGIRQDYEPKIEAARKKVADMLEKPDIKFSANFEANFAALSAAASKKNSGVREDFDSNLGYLTLAYFEGFVGQLEYQKFGEDEMLREGFTEAVEKDEISLKVVEKMKYGTYGEVVIEDGVCYIQTEAKNFGSNASYAAEKLMDQL